MMVTCGADWSASTTGRRNYAITLDKADYEEMTGKILPDGKDGLQALNVLADRLVVAYMYKEGAISGEYAEQRLRELHV